MKTLFVQFFLLMIISCLFFSGCATIITGSRDLINIRTSNGQEVKATITSAEGVGDITLPTILNAKKAKQNIYIEVKETNEYEQSNAVAVSRMNNWFWGNIILGGLLGSTTDAISGAMWQYDNTITVPIQKKSVQQK